jgi:hypothetical protein
MRSEREAVNPLDERGIRQYFLRAFAFRFLSTLLVGLFIVVGIVYMILYVPTFLYDDYLEIDYIGKWDHDSGFSRLNPCCSSARVQAG